MKSTTDKSVILGIPIDNLSMSGALDKIWGMIDKYQEDRKNRLVATANVDFVVNANKKVDEEARQSLMKILRNADMVTADGMPIVWLSQLLGNPLPERVTGADMVPAIAERAARDGKSIYFFGGIEGSAKKTATILSGIYPGLKVAGYTAPMIDMENEFENMVEIARINITEPDILLIALGNPKQEFWFDRYQKYLRVPVSIGIGGTFEFISGVTKRAPAWLQKSGFEWVYRMLQDPKRLIKRYATGLFRFNFMTMSLLTMKSVTDWFNQGKEKTQAQKQVLDYNALSDHEIIVEYVKRLRHVSLKYDFIPSTSKLHLEFGTSRTLSPEDIFTLMSIVLLCEKINKEVVVHNLHTIPKLLMKAYKIYDLVTVAK